MRGAHSLKGAARVVGLNDLVRLTHSMEDRVVAAQEGRALSSSDIDTLLAANDMLRAFAALPEADSAAWLTANVARMDELAATLAVEDTSSSSTQQEASARHPILRTWEEQ